MRWKQHPQAGLFSKDPTSDQESAGISFSKWDLFHYPTAAFQLLQSISFLASLKKQNKKTLVSKHPNMACCTGAFKSLGAVGIFFLCHRQRLLHDGPVQRRFNVIFPVAWIDHSLSLPLLSDLLLCKDLREAHIWSYRLREKAELVTRTLIKSLPPHPPTACKQEPSQNSGNIQPSSKTDRTQEEKYFRKWI